MKLFDRDLFARAVLIGMIIALMGISTRPHKVDQTFSQVLLSLSSGNSRQAAINIGKIAEYFPWWSNLWLHAGRYATQAGESKSAIDFFTRYGAVQDLSYEDQIILGDAYHQLGDFESAEQVWRFALRSRKSSPEIYFRLADIHRAQEDIPTLINVLKSLITIQPNNASIAFELGLFLSTQEPESALLYLEIAAKQDPKFNASARDLQSKINTAQLAEEPAYTLLEVGRSLAAMDEWKLASLAFRQATEIRADYAEAWAFLGEAQQHLSSISGASNTDSIGLTDLETALQLNPRSVTANVLMGIYWQRQNQYDQALHYIRSASNLNRENPMLQAELGRVLARTGDLDGAQERYQRAIELAPQDPTYWRLLAEFSMQYQLEIRQIALPAARQSILLSPNDPQSLDVMAQPLIMLGDDLNAERYLRRALEEDRQYAPAHMHLGIVYMNQGDINRGQLQFALAKDIAPDSWTLEQAQRLIGYYFP
jgi:tetratricopeptide (TPR) repeat protein